MLTNTTTNNPSPIELASRTDRLLAALIDIPLPVVVAVFFLWFSIRMQFELSSALFIIVMFTIAYISIQCYFLWTSAQTIGKHTLEIYVADYKTNKPLPFWRLILLRSLLASLPCLIPIAGYAHPFFDVLFIAGDKQRYIHNYVAGSKVVTVASARKINML